MEYLYPGGLAKAITFSYDDGQVYDRRLIEIFNQAGFKGTFHLNSGNLNKDGYVQKAELPTLYAEHEIACHGVTHRHPRQMNQTEWLREVWQDRLTLEELTGGIVQGMSYAFGEYYPEQVEALCAMGIQYSRTVESTGSFALPQELLRWKPTCHHNDKLLERAEKFLHVPGYEKMPLFYIWGHSFEFERENTWPLMEQLAEKLHGAQDIWYATNGQIADYDAAKVGQIHSVAGCDGGQQGGHDNDAGGVLHKHADDQQQDVDQQQEDVLVGGDGGEGMGQHLGNMLLGQNDTEYRGDGDDEQNCGGSDA